tara:strand:- start:280 stop:744 length:465 start_codon:yes stop_codon:yes gene_type:complete
MKNILLSLFALLLLCTFSFGKEEDRKKVEFFEKLYKTKIVGVKLLEDYPDPDQFYSAIAKQVGIPKVALDAVEKTFGWKQDDENFLAVIVKGGGNSDDWGVMVTKFPTALKTAKNKEEKMKLLKKMEMKMVLIGYDGKISFPEKKKRKTAPNQD